MYMSLEDVLVFGNLGNHIAIKSKEMLSSQIPPIAKLIALPQLIAPRCAQFPNYHGHPLLSTSQRNQRADRSVAGAQDYSPLCGSWRLSSDPHV